MSAANLVEASGILNQCFSHKTAHRDDYEV